MIQLRNLSMSFTLGDSRVEVLRGVDLDIDAGERVAVLGPSGSGKTTLLLLLAGLERPAAGAVRVDGVDLADLDADNLADLRRDRLGIIFQSFHLVPSLDALDNVALPLQIAGLPGSRERAREMLGAVGLGDRERHYPGQLSGGEQQRVALARAFATRPALLLADEPTGNLDRENGHLIMDMLFGLQEEHGSTLLLITHDAELAAKTSRKVLMSDGRISV